MEFKVVKFSRVMPKIEGKRGFHELMKGILLKQTGNPLESTSKKLIFSIFIFWKIFFLFIWFNLGFKDFLFFQLVFFSFTSQVEHFLHGFDGNILDIASVKVDNIKCSETCTLARDIPGKTFICHLVFLFKVSLEPGLTCIILAKTNFPFRLTPHFFNWSFSRAIL